MSAPQKIAIIGISGVGKSTFARALAERLDIPVYHGDALEWLPHWHERSRWLDRRDTFSSDWRHSALPRPATDR